MMHQLTPTIQVNISLYKKQLLQKMIPRSKKLGKKRNQRMLSKKIMNKPRTKKETTTPAMMGGGLTALKMSP
jgi:hypothetical protein